MRNEEVAVAVAAAAAAAHLVHRLLAHAAAHLAQQRRGAGAVSGAAEHVLVRVEVRSCVEVLDVISIIYKQSVRVLRVQTDQMQRGFEPLDFLRASL